MSSTLASALFYAQFKFKKEQVKINCKNKQAKNTFCFKKK